MRWIVVHTLMLCCGIISGIYIHVVPTFHYNTIESNKKLFSTLHVIDCNTERLLLCWRFKAKYSEEACMHCACAQWIPFQPKGSKELVKLAYGDFFRLKVLVNETVAYQTFTVCLFFCFFLAQDWKNVGNCGAGLSKNCNHLNLSCLLSKTQHIIYWVIRAINIIYHN